MNYDNLIIFSGQATLIFIVCKFFINQRAVIKNVVKIPVNRFA